MRITRTGTIFSFAYLVLGLAWVFGTTPPAPARFLAAWFVALAVVGAFVPGIANQVTLARG